MYTRVSSVPLNVLHYYNFFVIPTLIGLRAIIYIKPIALYNTHHHQSRREHPGNTCCSVPGLGQVLSRGIFTNTKTIFNLRDEILALVNRMLYLFRLH